jgi:predicted ArsR family transcriptional regulator
VDQPLGARVAAVAALEEPTRRRLYDHLVRQAGPITRDEAAAALELPPTTAAFHLNRLVDAGLLDVVYERRTGRTGPGAGRPSKLYGRSSRHVAVSLPERRYDLAGLLLAEALEDAERTGDPPRQALERHAHERGRDVGRAAREARADEGSAEALRRVLEEHGFEPHSEGDAIVLRNCPFHALAQQHTDLVCQMNLCLLDGLLDGLAATQLSARLEPRPDRCCVQLEPAGSRRS